MEVNNVSLAAVGVKLEQYPDDNKPEIAFVGKSNVGKSSLINGLLNRKSLARTSSSPGKTRTINFYNVEDLLYFVDLPGYGYAKAPKSEIRKWGKMIEDYLYKRESLKSIILLIDIRHQPSNNDKMMYEWLKHYNYEIIIIATKADKIKRSQLSKHISTIKNTLGMSFNEKIIAYSSMTKQGKQEIWNIFDDLLGIE